MDPQPERRGACLELAEPLRPQLSLGLRLRTPAGPIETEARVVWTRSPQPAEGGSLYGIAFTQLAPDHIEVLRRLLLSLQPWRRTQVRFPVDLAVICQPQRPPGPLYSSRVSDVSRGGLALCLPEVLLPFTALEVALPTPAGPLSLAGEIAWVDRPEGRKRARLIRHGMRFARLDWPTALVLPLLLAEPPNSLLLSPPGVRTMPR